MKSPSKGGVVQSLQMSHVHVLLVAPLCSGNVSQPGADQHQRGFPIREATHHTRPPSDLTVKTFNGVVGAYPRPVLRWEVEVGQCFLNTFLNLLGGFLEFELFKLRHNCLSFLPCGFLALLGMNCFEHLSNVFHLGLGNYAEHVTIEMHDAALVLSVREYFAHRFEHAEAFIANYEFDTTKTTSLEPLKEVFPTCLVLFHPFGSTQYLAVAILIDGNCYQNSYVFVLTSPIPTEIDSVHIDIRIVPLQWAVAPLLNVDVRLLVKLADGSG